MSRGKHVWKGAARRGLFVVIHTPRKGWVRIFRTDDNLLLQRVYDNSFITV